MNKKGVDQHAFPESGQHLCSLLSERYTSQTCYSRTLMARMMAHSPGLARTIIMVPTGHFMHTPPWMTGIALG